MAKKSLSRSRCHGLNHTMEQCLIEHRCPTKMGTITKMTVDVLTPQWQRLMIERNHRHIEEILGADYLTGGEVP